MQPRKPGQPHRGWKKAARKAKETAMTATDILLRLRAAIHMESARLAPQTSPEIELMREAADALERMRRLLLKVLDLDISMLLAEDILGALGTDGKNAMEGK